MPFLARSLAYMHFKSTVTKVLVGAVRRFNTTTRFSPELDPTTTTDCHHFNGKDEAVVRFREGADNCLPQTGGP